MSKVPRASLTITILRDEDYAVLMAARGGLEAFGVFAAMLLVGRERLQEAKARQLSGTESLRFDNSTTHLLAMAQIGEKQLRRAIQVIADAAKQTGSEPWMYLDDDGHLVIRSFFKFNTSKDWGGPRAGAGRPPKADDGNSSGIQDESQNNHLDSPPSPSPLPSTLPPTPKTPARVSHVPLSPKHADAVEVARDLLGDDQAAIVAAKGMDIIDSIRGAKAVSDDARFELYAAGLRRVVKMRDAGEAIRNFHVLAIKIANGISADPGALSLAPKPERVYPLVQAPPDWPGIGRRRAN